MPKTGAVDIITNQRTSRFIENVGFVFSMFVGGFLVLVEAGMIGQSTGFPWMGFTIVVGGFIPKTLGKASAGKVWDVLGNIAGRGK